MPSVIVTDHGPQFTSFQFEEYLQKKAIQHVRTSSYHPEANGGVERFNQVLKQGFNTHLANDKSIINAVRSILVNYRITPHALTRRSPAELMLGRKIPGPLDTLRLQTVSNSSKVQDTNENESLRADIQRKQEKVKSYVDKKRSARMSSFETGD